MAENKLKLYYSINEVSEMFNLPKSTLRYWEREFPDLRPRTSGNNIRQYSEKDLDILRTIHTLVKIRGFKIAAAKKMMHENPSGTDKTARIVQYLTSVRDQLQELKESLDKIV